LIILLDRF